MELSRHAPVLLIEDSPIVGKMMDGMMRSLGFFNIHVASSAENALGRLKISRYDLIISDWDMPGLSGIQLLLVVRADPRHQSTPFVMATAHASTAAIAKAKRAGVSAYLTKPYNRDDLRRVIQEATGIPSRAAS